MNSYQGNAKARIIFSENKKGPSDSVWCQSVLFTSSAGNAEDGMRFICLDFLVFWFYHIGRQGAMR